MHIHYKITPHSLLVGLVGQVLVATHIIDVSHQHQTSKGCWWVVELVEGMVSGGFREMYLFWMWLCYLLVFHYDHILAWIGIG